MKPLFLEFIYSNIKLRDSSNQNVDKLERVPVLQQTPIIGPYNNNERFSRK